MKFIRYFTAADQSARYSTFFTANSEKSRIACRLVRAEYANCCHGIIEMMRTGFRKLYFFSYSLQRTSHDFENNRKTMLTETNQSLLSWEVSQPPPCEQKSQPTAVVTRREQQEAATHCGSEFEKSDILTLTKKL